MNNLSPDPRLPVDSSPLTIRLYEILRDILTRVNWLLDGGIKVVTTTEKNALVAWEGRTVFDTTLNKLCVYTGSAWETITSS